jgi:hypothetical protein
MSHRVAIALVTLGFAACTAAPPPPPAQAPPPPLAGVAVSRPSAPDPERWIGALIEPVTESLARASGLSRVEGLYVRAVEPGSPAARAGIQPGDVLVLAGGAYLGTFDALPRVLAGAPIGSTVEVALRRGGELRTAMLPIVASPGGRLLTVIPTPSPLSQIAADGAQLYGFGAVPGSEDRGIVPLQLPGGPLPRIAPRPVASPGAERVIAADAERVYLGWAGSELYVDYYELESGRVGRLPVRGAESLANRCRARGLARVGSELWLACQRPDGPAVARIDLGSGAARVEPLPPTYWGGLAFDGEGVLWLCCASEGRLSLARTDLASGAAKVFPLPEPALGLAADAGVVYVLAPDGGIYVHKPWR